MTRPLVMILAVAVAGCAPQPRSMSFFKAHHAEAARVAAACKAGQIRGPECENAEAGVLDAQLEAQKAYFHRGF